MLKIVFLIISELNRQIYGCQKRSEGNYERFYMKLLEEQGLSDNYYKFNEVKKEIKF